MRLVVLALAVLSALQPEPAVAQSATERFQLGLQIASVSYSQFDDADVGLGGRVAWHPSRWLGVEGEFNFYPQAFPDRNPFSRGRREGLFGATFGLAFDRMRPFARVRSGFMNVRDAGGPVVCILIFPPPLSCTLASGRTLAAFDLGGGLEFLTTPRSFVRVDLGDLLLRYPRTVLDTTGTVRDGSSASHNFRVAGGIGARF